MPRSASPTSATSWRLGTGVTPFVQGATIQSQLGSAPGAARVGAWWARTVRAPAAPTPVRSRTPPDMPRGVCTPAPATSPPGSTSSSAPASTSSRALTDDPVVDVATPDAPSSSGSDAFPDGESTPVPRFVLSTRSVVEHRAWRTARPGVLVIDDERYGTRHPPRRRRGERGAPRSRAAVAGRRHAGRPRARHGAGRGRWRMAGARRCAGAQRPGGGAGRSEGSGQDLVGGSARRRLGPRGDRGHESVRSWRRARLAQAGACGIAPTVSVRAGTRVTCPGTSPSRSRRPLTGALHRRRGSRVSLS